MKTRLRVVGMGVVLLSLTALAGADEFTSQRELLPPPTQAGEQPALPELTGAEKAYLMKLARQALSHSIQTGKVFQATKVPETLARKDYPTYVTARLAGRIVESAIGADGTIAENIAKAAAAVAPSKDFGQDRLAGLRDSAIEINVLGPGQLINYRTVDHVSNAMIPGIHGMGARIQQKVEGKFEPVTVRFKESVAPTRGYNAELSVLKLIEKAGWTPAHVTAWVNPRSLIDPKHPKPGDADLKRMNGPLVKFFRFRAIHLLEQPAGDGYVELIRCAPLVGQDQVTDAHLGELIDLMGQHLCYRQMDSGLFSYSYMPFDGSFAKDDNSVRQAAAAWAAARLAQASTRPEYELVCLKAIAAAKLKYLDNARKAAYATYPIPQDRETLGQTALLLAATIDLPNNRPVIAIRDRLAAGVLAQQQADGSFRLYYNDTKEDGNRFYYPGEALLALMKLHQQTGDQKYLDAVVKAFDCYHALFQNEPNKSFVPWHAQAWALAYDATGQKKYAEFVFEMADYLGGFQANEGTAISPDMVGAFVSDAGSGGVGTASFLEGMVPAHRMAVKLGDAKRAAKYAQALRLGARFLDQLTFKKIDAFYCVMPRDVIGGVKNSPVDHTLRIDNCQHAVCAMMGIRDELFPKKTGK